MDNFQIETAQNVNISQNTAGIGERIFAYLIDTAVMGIYILLLILTLANTFDVLPDGARFAIGITISLPILLYHLLFEMFWDGKSLGKAALQLKVVKIDGSKPSFSNYLLRWLLRPIEITVTSGGLAVVAILFNGKGQRIGDIAGTTTVISEKPRTFLQQTIYTEIPNDYKPNYPQVTVFTDAEMQNIKNIYRNAKYKGNHNIVLKLANKVSKVMDVEIDGTPMVFIEKVIKDYNFYTQQ